MGKELLEPRKHWGSFLIFQFTMLENTIKSDHFGSFFFSILITAGKSKLISESLLPLRNKLSKTIVTEEGKATNHQDCSQLNEQQSPQVGEL